MANIEVLNVAQPNPEAPIEIQLSSSNIVYRGPAGPAGRDGIIGRDGKSAYEIAVENGFEGTETDWLASLQGEPGQDGSVGPVGPAGAIGPQGPKGDTPIKGVDYFTQQDIATIAAQMPTADLSDYSKAVSIAVNETITGDKATTLQTVQTELVNETYDYRYNIWLNGSLAYPVKNIASQAIYPDLLIFNKNGYYFKYSPSSVNNESFYASGQYVDLQGEHITISSSNSVSPVSTVLDAQFGYIKSQYASKAYVEEAIRGAESGFLKRSVVQTLPSSDIDEDTIYMVPKTGGTGDVYDEYLYVNNTWEKIGSTAVDLTNYALKSELFSGDYDDLTNKPTIPAAYTLPIASTTALGGIKVDGSTINIDANGVISAAASGGSSYTAGYGISIDSNDVISSSQNPLVHSMLQMTTAGNSMPQTVRLTNTSTWDEFVDNVKAGRIVYITTSTSYTFTESYKLTPALLGISNLYAMNLDQISVPMMGTSVASYPATGTQIYYQTYYYFDGEILWSWKNPEDLGNFIKVRFKTYKNYALGRALADINTDIAAKFTAPAAATTDGAYVLKSTVSSGTATYAWGAESSYTLPAATTATLGGVMVDGSSITVDGNGVISAVSTGGGGSSADLTGYATETYVDSKVLPVLILDFNKAEAESNIIGTTTYYNIVRENANTYAQEVINEFDYAVNHSGKLEHYGAVYYDGKLYTPFWDYNNPSQLELRTVNWDQTDNKIKLYRIIILNQSNRIRMYANYHLAYRTGNGISFSAWGNDPYQQVIAVNMNYINSNLTLPKATTSTVGGVRVDGSTIIVDSNGIISSAFTAPTTDGTYTLQCVVSSGTPTYSWVAV